MAEQNLTKAMEDLLTAYKTFTVDLPLAGTRWVFGIDQKKDVTTTAWKGYDASIRLATAAVDSLYRTPLFGTTVSNVANQLLRWQQVGNSVTNLLSTNAWRGVGVPARTEVQALAERVKTLEAHVNEPARKIAPRPLITRLRPLDSHTSKSTPTAEERAAA